MNTDNIVIDTLNVINDVINMIENESQNTPKFRDIFQDTIEYQHLDGTLCKFNHATYYDLGDGWFVIDTEHNGKVKLHKDDVRYVKVTKDDYIVFNDEKA